MYSQFSDLSNRINNLENLLLNKGVAMFKSQPD